MNETPIRTRKRFEALSFQLIALVFLVAGTTSSPRLDAADSTGEPTSKPNILFILVDDLGWKDVGYHGSEIRTPNIDKLAASGAKLEQHYVMPVCSPTRACLMTGRYPIRTGLQTLVIFPWAEYGLPLEERTLPQALRTVGYDTYMAGKWHLGHFKKAYLPMQRGFDHHYGCYNGALDYFKHEIQGVHDWHRDGRPVHEEGRHTTGLLGDEAVRVIQSHDDSKPFFLYVALNAPHAPLQVEPGSIKGYESIEDPERRKYAAMVTGADAQIGRIISALEAKKLTGNTLIIFSSDNGGVVHEGANNGLLRAGKVTLYEGGIRVPCFVSWPGKVTAGTVVNAPVHMVDWYPTLLGLAKASLDQALKLDGLDIWPTIASGRPTPHDEILLNVAGGRGAIRRGDWKLVINGNSASEDLRLYGTLGMQKLKEVKSAEKVVELFNIADDPSERKNLAKEHPDKVAELMALLDRYAKEAVPSPIVPEPVGYAYPKVWGEEE